MQKDDEAGRQELERQLERAKRLAAVTTDRTTYDRIRDFAADLRQRLQRLMSPRRGQDEIQVKYRLVLASFGKRRAGQQATT
jgi:hypothetical protein